MIISAKFLKNIDIFLIPNTVLLLGFVLMAGTLSSQTITNLKAENVLLGNYNPNDYAPTVSTPIKDIIINQLLLKTNADSLKSYLVKLESFHNRNSGSDTVSNTRGIGATRRWIASKFTQFSSQNENRLLVGYLNFTKDICKAKKHRNVFGLLPGLDLNKPDILVVEAHMDSRCENVCDTACYAPGMDDNGSGTALIIELARVLSAYAFDRTILLTTVTGEEQGLDGGAAWAAYLSAQKIDVMACINNDVVGGIECGTNSSPPSCSPSGALDSMNLRVFSFSPFNDTNYVSVHKQLARYLKLQQIEEINVRTGMNYNIDLQILEDRKGRGGDHIPFRQRGFRAVRLTSSHEHGDGSGKAPDRQHTTTDVLGYDTSVPLDGILDTFLVNFNYLRRNALVNAVNLSLLANAPPIPVPVYHRNPVGNLESIEFIGTDTLYAHRLGVRTANSQTLYFDTVLNVTGHFYSALSLPKGDVQIHAMNVEGEIESLPHDLLHEEYLSLESLEELSCFKLFPNPNDGILNLQWACERNGGLAQLYLYNHLGQLIYEEELTFESDVLIKLDLKFLSRGLYNLNVISNQNESFHQKIIRQ